MAALSSTSSAPAALPVRWSEGTLHGFLELRAADSTLLATGDQLQIPRDSGIETRLTFQFKDGSAFDETTTFTQHGVFTLESYHLVQTGDAFNADLDARFSRNGDYVVTTKSHADGKTKEYKGTLDLPADVYNGLIPVITKNIPENAARTVHVVAFTPKPIVIPLELIPQATGKTVRFTLKPRLNLLLRIGAALKGQTPPNSYLWVLTDKVPTFVRFEGPLYSGPAWQINLTRPRWP